MDLNFKIRFHKWIEKKKWRDRVILDSTGTDAELKK